MWWITLFLIIVPLEGLSHPVSRRELCQRSILTISTGIGTGWWLSGNANDDVTRLSSRLVNPCYAAYTREVGGTDKSPEQAAYNIQVGW
jgi:hypothetical protein